MMHESPTAERFRKRDILRHKLSKVVGDYSAVRDDVAYVRYNSRELDPSTLTDESALPASGASSVAASDDGREGSKAIHPASSQLGSLQQLVDDLLCSESGSDVMPLPQQQEGGASEPTKARSVPLDSSPGGERSNSGVPGAAAAARQAACIAAQEKIVVRQEAAVREEVVSRRQAAGMAAKEEAASAREPAHVAVQESCSGCRQLQAQVRRLEALVAALASGRAELEVRVDTQARVITLQHERLYELLCEAAHTQRQLEAGRQAAAAAVATAAALRREVAAVENGRGARGGAAGAERGGGGGSVGGVEGAGEEREGAAMRGEHAAVELGGGESGEAAAGGEGTGVDLGGGEGGEVAAAPEGAAVELRSASPPLASAPSLPSASEEAGEGPQGTAAASGKGEGGGLRANSDELMAEAAWVSCQYWKMRALAATSQASNAVPEAGGAS